MRINDDKNLKVPTLRFKNFTENWTKYKVSDILDFYSTNSLAWESLSYEKPSEMMNLHYGLIHSGLPTITSLIESKLPFIKVGMEPKKYTLINNGDIFFADASEDTDEIGKSIEIINTNNNKVVSGLHTIHARDNKHLLIDGFKGYLFNSYPFHYQLKRLAQGTKIYSITSNNFNEIYVNIPSKDEQLKIFTLLYKLDQLIETQRKLINNYETLIKVIYNQIGNYKGNQINFQDIYSKASEGGTPSTSNKEYFDGNIPFVKIEDLSNKYLDKTSINISEKGLKNSSSWLIPENSIILSNGATIGQVSINTVKVATKQGILGIVPKKQYQVEYLYSYFQSHYFKKELHRKISIGTIKTAYLRDINEIKCYIPSFEEQNNFINRINYFQSIIMNSNLELNHLGKMKSNLLRGLFI